MNEKKRAERGPPRRPVARVYLTAAERILVENAAVAARKPTATFIRESAINAAALAAKTGEKG